MSSEVPSNQERPLVERIQQFAGTIIDPKRISGWLLLILWLAVALCAMLSSVLFWLGLAQSSASWRLFAFSAMFLSGCIYMLASALPQPFAGLASRVGLVGLVVSIFWVKLAPGA